jgi:hypothetical protein
MGQATRLFVLQNKQVSQIVSMWSMMAMKLFHSTNASDRIVNEFINNDCSRGESIADILHRSSKLFCFGVHFIQRQEITIETTDTTEILASKLIERLSYNVSTGLYVLDVQGGEVNKTAIVPILLRTEDSNHYQCVAAVYRSSTGGGNKVLMRLVTRSLTGVCDNCYYYSQCVVISSKGQPEQLKSKQLKSKGQPDSYQT